MYFIFYALSCNCVLAVIVAAAASSFIIIYALFIFVRTSWLCHAPCPVPRAPMEVVTWKWVPHGVCVMHAYMLVNQRSRTEHIL